mmetsp:Transcript_48328/g.103538  ORF Transcript_48328/g.103538 Transcript_48328/m.103538 type:complete len:454 (-) Transcript_48328:1023-2384(-)
MLQESIHVLSALQEDEASDESHQDGLPLLGFLRNSLLVSQRHHGLRRGSARHDGVHAACDANRRWELPRNRLPLVVFGADARAEEGARDRLCLRSLEAVWSRHTLGCLAGLLRQCFQLGRSCPRHFPIGEVVPSLRAAFLHQAPARSGDTRRALHPEGWRCFTLLGTRLCGFGRGWSGTFRQYSRGRAKVPELGRGVRVALGPLYHGELSGRYGPCDQRSTKLLFVFPGLPRVDPVPLKQHPARGRVQRLQDSAEGQRPCQADEPIPLASKGFPTDGKRPGGAIQERLDEVFCALHAWRYGGRTSRSLCRVPRVRSPLGNRPEEPRNPRPLGCQWEFARDAVPRVQTGHGRSAQQVRLLPTLGGSLVDSPSPVPLFKILHRRQVACLRPGFDVGCRIGSGHFRRSGGHGRPHHQLRLFGLQRAVGAQGLDLLPLVLRVTPLHRRQLAEDRGLR